MKNWLCLLFFFLFIFEAQAQSKFRTAQTLLQEENSGWPIVQKWIDSAKNKVEILTTDSAKALDAIYQMQLTTHAPMGAILYNTGGILIDDGWIKILGSGNKQLHRTLPGWNKGKTMHEPGDSSSFLLVADDAAGGFFAINNGQFNKQQLGKIFYLSPDRLSWEALDLNYSEFLLFCFNGDLDKFYGNMRWANWQKDLAKLPVDNVFNFNPPLWSKEGKEMSKNKRKKISVEKQYQFNMQARKQLNLENQ